MKGKSNCFARKIIITNSSDEDTRFADISISPPPYECHLERTKETRKCFTKNCTMIGSYS